MPCSAETYQGGAESNWSFINWSSRVAGFVRDYFEPDSLQDLVKVVQDASLAGREVRVMGSRWAFEDLAYSTDVGVSLARLNRPIDSVLSMALTAAWQEQQASSNGDKLFHVEAGIVVADLNSLLDAQQPKLAMATLGGSNGQSLAGAMTTGTHGCDIDLPPIADMVVAMHLVGTGGREIWIERQSDPITDEVGLANVLAASCADTEIVRSDVLFDAALVSMGRFGIIYSCVLRVRSAFDLAEWTTVQSWESVRALLQRGIDDGTFLAPLLNSLPPPMPELGSATALPSCLEIVLNTLRPETCWVKRRWPTGDPTRMGIELKEDSLCAFGYDKMLGTVNSVFDGLIAAAAAATLFNVLGGLILTGVMIAAKAKFNADLAGIPNRNVGDICSLALNTLWDLQLGAIPPEIEKAILEERYAITTTTGKRGPSYIIKTGWPQESQQACYRADSVEPVFDAWKADYLAFMDVLIRELKDYRQAGYISLRYSASSRASLSMHRLASPNGVAIEVTSLRSLKDNPTWMIVVENLGLSHGGRPHWGQINQSTKRLCFETEAELTVGGGFSPLSNPRLYAIYGEDLRNWRSALAWAAHGDTRTFSCKFTRERALEPRPQTPALNIDSVRAGDLSNSVAGAISAIADLLLQK